jgi:hypothetical protein
MTKIVDRRRQAVIIAGAGDEILARAGFALKEDVSRGSAHRSNSATLSV